jgi:uncharacterized membrane protein YbhN (UPF0104 family)
VIRTIILGFLVDLFRLLLIQKGKLLLVLLTLTGAVLGLVYGVFSGFLAYLFHVPGVIYLFLAPRIISNVIFGALGGIASFYLLDKLSWNMQNQKEQNGKSGRQKTLKI